MPEWISAGLREFGLGNVIVIAIGIALALLWRTLWPFFVTQMWPEIKTGWQYKRTASQSQSEKLSALYDVLIKINSDNIISNAQTVATLKDIQQVFRESITILENQSNSRHDELIVMFTKLVDRIDRQIDVASQLIEQWQKMMTVPPFVEERRQGLSPFSGPEKRRQ